MDYVIITSRMTVLKNSVEYLNLVCNRDETKITLTYRVLKYCYPRVNQQRGPVIFPQTLQIQSDHLNQIPVLPNLQTVA